MVSGKQQCVLRSACAVQCPAAHLPKPADAVFTCMVAYWSHLVLP